MRTAAFISLVQWIQLLGNALPSQSLEIALAKNCEMIKQETARFSVAVAHTPAEMAKGLSKRPQELLANEGMLFWFDSPRAATFWMRDTWIPMRILFFDSQGTLLNHKLMQVEKDPSTANRTYLSNGMAKVALEISPKIKVSSDLRLCVSKPIQDLIH